MRMYTYELNALSSCLNNVISGPVNNLVVLLKRGGGVKNRKVILLWLRYEKNIYVEIVWKRYRL